MKNQSERGSVLIGVIVSLSLAAFLYVSSSSSFFKTITRQKSKNQLDVLSKSLNNAVFNYTAYALKERWCMDSSWGRDLSCNGMSDMKQFVTHPRNLERFLWSSNTVNDLALRYQKLYGAPPAGLSLDKIEQVISMASLESLGSSHPLNLVMNDLIKQCLTSIKVSIEKPLSSYYKSQGDEIYLLITVTGNLVIDPLNNCSLIKNTPVVKGLVIVYPKTLNQYSVIKTGSFNVSDFPRTDQGLNFHGPVYVQRNIKLSSKGKFGVSFKDKVNIGEGVVQLDGVPFSPKTPGGFSDQFLSQLQTTNGFMNGISLEAEPDLGIPRLFDKNYTYPLDPNKALCANRKNLKDNFILSRDSRLWVKGNDGNYTFTLSGDNEFREYVRHGQKDGKYIYNKYDDSFASKHKNIRNTYNVELLGQAPTTKPVMEAQIFINGVNFSTIYLGRTSDAKITFGDKNFFQNQKDLLDTPETTFLNIGSIDKDGLGINNDLKKEYSKFEDECRAAIASAVGIPECKKVMETGAVDAQTNCSILPLPADVAICEATLTKLKTEKNKYFSTHKNLVNNLNGFINNLPSVDINTSELLSNKENVKINWNNKDSFKYEFVSRIDFIKIKFNVYDYAIEESNDTTSGAREGKYTRLPGPNENGNGKENSMVFDITRDGSGTVTKFLTKKSDGTILDANGEYGTTLQRWNKSLFNAEPPGNGTFKNRIDYPTDGVSVAEARRLDLECTYDSTVLPQANWDVSFTEKTQFSWLYNVTSPGITITDPNLVQPMPTYTFTTNDMSPGSYQGVPTRSIVKECIVPNTIDFVFGFYVCENIVIESRSSPLNFVGTFIVNDFKIDSSALMSGVNFYSIWSPGGIELLKEKKHLRREKSANSECKFDKPGWFKGLDEDSLADYQACSPAKFLYQGANNFNWTTIDPEIGVTGVPGQYITQSKIANRYRRYGVNVVWLRSGFEQ